MDPVISPLIYKDSGRRTRVDPGESHTSGVRSAARGILLARIVTGETMDPVTSPLIPKDSGRRARADPGELDTSER